MDETPELIERLIKELEALIAEKGVNTFYFGSKSQFDELCHRSVTALKEKYPHIKRVYIRAAYPDISDTYKNYLLKSYEDTCFISKMRGAGKASYVERNQEMINRSDFCVVYYDENYAPPKRKSSRRDLRYYQPKSGTKIAYDYAMKKKRMIINLFV